MTDNESEDGEDGDYTVYECPGLAPVINYTIFIPTTIFVSVFFLQTGEMEVRNPMFEDDVTPKANK